MINVEFSKQQVNKTWSLQIESSMSNLNGSMSASSTNETTVDSDATFSAEIPQESNALNLGPILGPCLLFLIILLYVWGKRVERQEEEERTREASRLEENRRKFLKDHVNIKVHRVLSPTPCIDDEEVQQHRDTDERSQPDEKDYCSKPSSADHKTDENIELDDRSHSSKHTLEDEIICPICHETFQEGEVITWSKNEVCCHSRFHGDCIISWLMTDKNECPLCRSIFIPSNQIGPQIKSKQ